MLYDEFAADVRACTKCPLSDTRTQVVVDRGHPGASLGFLGEAPGFAEDKVGQVFVGAPGRELDALVAAEGLTESDYVCFNVLKCRPPGNRFPGDQGSAVDIKALHQCLPWLDQQIALIKPKVMVLVGKRAGQWLLFRGKGRCPSMSEMARNWYRSEDYPGIEFFAMYHPAFLLRKRDEDPAAAEEVQELTERAIRRAVSVLRGQPLGKDRPEIVPSLSFRKSKNQGTLF